MTQQALSGSAVTPATTTYSLNAANEICWADPTNYTGTDGCTTTPTGATDYTYDVDGNQTTGAGFTATYNALNQMTSATTGGTTTDDGYIGTGNSFLTTDGSNTLTDTNLGVDHITNGSSTSNYTRSTNGTVLDERLSSGTYNYLYDGQGNVVALTNSTGVIQNQYAYDPAGNKITNTQAVANPFGFEGGYTTSSGLEHFGARYYNPTQGTWTQTDPSGQDAGYTYAGDDPINASDTSGLAEDAALNPGAEVDAETLVALEGVSGELESISIAERLEARQQYTLAKLPPWVQRMVINKLANWEPSTQGQPSYEAIVEYLKQLSGMK